MLFTDREMVTKLTQDLIRVRSYSGEEKGMVNLLKTTFDELGFDDYHIDEYGNIIARIKGKQAGKRILFDSHIDTVRVPDPSQWTVDPFAGQILDDKIYGRGASDMKGALASSIIAAYEFAKATNRDFPGEIYISGVVHEECFEGIGARKVSEYVKPDYVVICEASELNLKIGQRGRGEIVFETYGKPAHSANPDKGVNAVYKAAELIRRVRQLEMTYDDYLGHGILELVDIKSSPYPGASVVPDYCKITYDRRLLVGETKESVLEPLIKLIEELKSQDSDFEADVFYAKGKEECWTGSTIEGERFFPGWRYDEEAEFVQDAYKGIKEMGLSPEITQYSFCTNGSHYAGEAEIKTMGYGPSRENLAHTIDEYVEIDQLVKAVNGYYGIMKGLLK